MCGLDFILAFKDVFFPCPNSLLFSGCVCSKRTRMKLKALSTSLLQTLHNPAAQRLLLPHPASAHFKVRRYLINRNGDVGLWSRHTPVPVDRTAKTLSRLIVPHFAASSKGSVPHATSTVCLIHIHSLCGQIAIPLVRTGS